MGRASDPHEQREDRKYQASKRAAESLLNRLGVRLEQLDRFVDDPPDGETFITEVRFKVNAAWDGGVLMIVKATINGEKVIGFHGDDGLAETLAGGVNRLSNGSMKWKEDKPYGSSNGQ